MATRTVSKKIHGRIVSDITSFTTADSLVANFMFAAEDDDSKESVYIPCTAKGKTAEKLICSYRKEFPIIVSGVICLCCSASKRVEASVFVEKIWTR